MLNHTYTSVKNANLVDCGKKTHISSQPSPLLKDNFLGEFRTELDKKKVLSNLGIATELSLEWEYIKGDIGRSVALMQELDSRTKYTSKIDGFYKTVIEGIEYLETVVGGEQEDEKEQNDRLTALEQSSKELEYSLNTLKTYITETVDINIETLLKNLDIVTKKVDNITNLIQVSTKANNALILIPEGSEDLQEGETSGLYVPDLSGTLSTATDNIKTLRDDVDSVLKNYVTKDDLGGGDFDFVDLSDFDSYTKSTQTTITNILSELAKTVKTGEDGHVDTLYVNLISKNNDDGSIKISDSFEVTSGIPLDVRFVVETLDDLLALPAKNCYSGMGVIVNSLSSLYILRKPKENSKLNQEYIGNVYNWKCPEDLVTVALTRTEYENLEEINPNVFYYIYEEEITRTLEPKPEEFENIEAYEEAFLQWINSLKTLSQEYMSASWGIDIESKLSKKANQSSVNVLNNNIKNLQTQIDNLSGGDSETSLGSLAIRVTETEKDLLYLLGTEGVEEESSTKGKITEIEDSISSLDTKVTSEYVSKESITTENDLTNYIFVKKSDYTKDILDRETALKLSITTNYLTANSVETSNIILSELPITSNGLDLLINNKEVALFEEVPKMEYLSQKDYDDKLASGDIDPDTYYYTTNEEIYVTKTSFDEKIKGINTSVSAANKSITTLDNKIISMQTLIDSLLAEIEILKNKIDNSEETPESNI